jgi:DNA-binding GntR family transcriptional regulator
VQVLESLRDQMASGALPPGTVLNIGLLADQHDVSRPTVAHALRVLEADGMVRRYPGVGWQVEGK